MSGVSGSSYRVVEIDWRRKESRIVEREVAPEIYISLFVNGKRFRDFLASPGMLKEFAYGHLLCEGIIDSIDDVMNVSVEGAKIGVELREGLDLRLRASKEVRLVQPECNPPDPDFLSLLDKTRKPSVDARLKVDVDTLFKMLKEVNKRSRIYKSTRGVHSASLFEAEGNILSIAEDVGRHNAVDKVVGEAILKGISFSDTVLLCSGRPTVGMVLKVARVGIPIAASLSAPTEWGVKVAQDTGVTLVSARGNFTVYSHPERVNLG